MLTARMKDNQVNTSLVDRQHKIILGSSSPILASVPSPEPKVQDILSNVLAVHHLDRSLPMTASIYSEEGAHTSGEPHVNQYLEVPGTDKTSSVDVEMPELLHVAATGGGPSRRSHTKSRKGCKACKRGHIRCDETFPQWQVPFCVHC